jgi:hypothetical protein
MTFDCKQTLLDRPVLVAAVKGSGLKNLPCGLGGSGAPGLAHRSIRGQNETPPSWLVAYEDGVSHLCTPRDLNPEPID